eukprot:COSAG03_NODE_12002_length_565_cov_1.231263_2_plen_42_part_01
MANVSRHTQQRLLGVKYLRAERERERARESERERERERERGR